MKEKELREAAVCGLCGQPFGRSSFGLSFWRVTIERHGVRADTVMRQQGLTMVLGGNAKLAQVMGPDEDMTMPLLEPVQMTVCEDCSTRPGCVAALAESAERMAARQRMEPR